MKLDWLEKLDRRWLFLIVAVLVMGPLLKPLGLPLGSSKPVQQFHDAIAALPEGSIVLMSCDYDPGGKPELVPMTRPAFRQLMEKHCRVVITCLWTGGSGLVDETIEGMAQEMRAQGHDLVYGRD